MSVQELIENQKRGDGQIIHGVYISMAIRDNGKLITLYIGTKESGPMLQYDPDGKCRYNGEELTGEEQIDLDKKFSEGVWTPIYSRGDYKRNYACGGHWSGHTKNLHQSVGITWSGKQEHRGDIITELMVLPENGGIVELPYGVSSGDVKRIDIDCSTGWVIWYDSAEKVMDARLTPNEMIEARLPIQSINHLVLHEDESVIKIKEVINAFGL